MKYADESKFKYENLFSDSKENLKPEVQQPVELAKDWEIIGKPKQEDTKTTVVIKSPVISDAGDLKLLDKETQADKPIVNTHEDSSQRKTKEDSKVKGEQEEENFSLGKGDSIANKDYFGKGYRDSIANKDYFGKGDSIANKDYLERRQAFVERQPKQDIRYERRNQHDDQNRFETRDEYMRRSQLSQRDAAPRDAAPRYYETRDEYMQRSNQQRYDDYRNYDRRQGV